MSEMNDFLENSEVVFLLITYGRVLALKDYIKDNEYPSVKDIASIIGMEEDKSKK